MRLFSKGERSQTLVMFVFFVLVLVIFVGLGIDLGFAYVTKSELTKSLDAAALTGARNVTSANMPDMVRNIFALNYGRPGRDTGTVVPTATVVNEGGSRRLRVSAAATINTYFIRILPRWQTLTVRAEAEAIRSRLVMSVILDRSGSMLNNGGYSALPPAMDTFIGIFDDNLDKAALVTFSSTADTVVTMRRPFKQAISNAVPRGASHYAGATFMSAGLSNGWAEIQSEPIIPGENVTRVAVFFTDGLANIIQERVRCESGQATQAWNFGGLDPQQSHTTYWVINATTGVAVDSGMPPSDCNNPGLRQFNRVDGGVQTTITMDTIRDEAEDRTMDLANRMRNDGITVYSVGLGSNVNAAFLRSLANSPDSPNYNPSLPSGVAVFSPTADQLRAAFQVVASDILGRLTR